MTFHELLAYKKSFALAMKIFEITKLFPKEETYSLTDQIRRSSEVFLLPLRKPTEKEFIQNIFTVN